MVGRKLISNKSTTRGSEYGGVEGMIQPPPHKPTPPEKLKLIYQTNPYADAQYADGTTVVDDVPIPETQQISK